MKFCLGKRHSQNLRDMKLPGRIFIGTLPIEDMLWPVRILQFLNSTIKPAVIYFRLRSGFAVCIWRSPTWSYSSYELIHLRKSRWIRGSNKIIPNTIGTCSQGWGGKLQFRIRYFWKVKFFEKYSTVKLMCLETIWILVQPYCRILKFLTLI